VDNHDHPDDIVLPDIGRDKAPTEDMIIRGAVGNGSWERFTPALASQIQLERAEMKRELKLGRKEAYEEGVKDALGSIAALEIGILEIGTTLLDKLGRGEALSRKEIDTLKLAQKAAVEMKDRAMGRSKTMAEVKTQQSILHLIAGIGVGNG